jgi:hypothetical protein
LLVIVIAEPLTEGETKLELISPSKVAATVAVVLVEV